MHKLTRRHFIQSLGAGLAASSFPAIVRSATTRPHIVVIGGGFAGATVAKYLRHWSTSVDVTLVEPETRYHSCILSNLILNNSLKLDDITFDYATLGSRYGIRVVNQWVAGIDASGHFVELGDGSKLSYDRLVVAPGVSFDKVPGLDINLIPHAWKAGSQTLQLQQQINSMPEAGVFVMTVPKAPYRCPPGPYERACLVADFLRKNKPGSKVIVLDANASIQAEKKTFSHAFDVTYADMLEYYTDANLESVDSARKIVTTGIGEFTADVLNVIPNQRAGQVVLDSGLAADGKWAGVNPLSYESLLVKDVHIIGDSQATGQPKAGHIANAEAKVCADAILRILGGNEPYESPVTNSACYSPITADTASWLTAVFAYDAATGTMKVVPESAGEASAPSNKHYKTMFDWADNLFFDTFG